MIDNKCDISVIVPYYYGKKYLADMYGNLKCSADGFDGKIEWIIVNDSPDDEIRIEEISGITDASFEIKIIVNEKNSGIHYSRVHGLENATGEYVLFLDQDDSIEAQFFRSQYEKVKGSDLVVANASIEKEDGTAKKLYETENDFEDVRDIEAYSYKGNRIASPGQCLIRREAVPELWMKSIMNVNGADDVYLWILLLAKNAEIRLNHEVLYTHKYTGSNLSDSYPKMLKSLREMKERLKNSEVPKYVVRRMIRSYHYQSAYISAGKCMQKFVWIFFPDVIINDIKRNKKNNK